MNKRQKEMLQHHFDSEKAVLEQLEKQYQTALNDINRKIRILQSDEMTQSKIYRMEYQKALKKQVEAILEKLHSDEFTTIQEYLSASYTDAFIGTMYDLAGQGIPLIIPLDQAAAVKAILTDSKISKGLYSALGIDVNALKKTISAEVTRGIASGMSYHDIARNIDNASHTTYYNAVRIARTEGHRIQQASTQDAQQQAKSKGADVVKQWDSTLDGKTRESHRRVDGEIRELDEKFSNGLDFPGDPNGKAKEVINCRCVSLTRARWALDEDELNTLKERASFFELDKSKNFADFKKKYLKAASEPLEKSSKSSTMKAKEMFSKKADARSGFKFISNERFEQLTIAAKKKGAVILRGTDEIEKHLDAMEASASTIGDVLLFRNDVCISEVLEETYHFTQNIDKVNDDKGEPLRTILNEIDAKKYVLQNADKYKIPRNELDLVKKQLEGYEQQLEEYMKGDN